MMFILLKPLTDTGNIRLVPSALAGMTGPVKVIRENMVDAGAVNATHILWATGGSVISEEEMATYYAQSGK